MTVRDSPARAPAGSIRIDPLAPSHPGRWEDAGIVVCHVDRAPVPVRLVAARPPERVTDHFEVHRPGDRLLVLHRLRPDELDDDIAGLVAQRALRRRGLGGRLRAGVHRDRALDDQRPAHGVVDVLREQPRRAPPPPRSPPTPARRRSRRWRRFAPVHERAVAEVRGRTVLDVGSCFGFLPLRLAQEGFAWSRRTTPRAPWACSAPSPGAAARPCAPSSPTPGALPAADRSVDTVTAVHLLEHLPAEDTETVLDEMLRVARRRVVVAVPYEDVPEPVYGHLRTFDHADLHALGERSGRPSTVADDHGGWLVVEVG